MTNFAVKLKSLPGHLDQSLKRQNDPQAVLCKFGFINSFCRSLSFGLILTLKIGVFCSFDLQIFPSPTEFRKKREIVYFKSKNSAKTKAPTKKMNKIKFVEHDLRIILPF